MRTDTIDRESLFDFEYILADEVGTARSCILVLGMHRSGTSAVCGALAELGADRPVRELLPQPDNEKGFFEPAEIVLIHDRILHAAGTTWLGWDPLPETFFGSAEAEALRGELIEALRQDFPGTGPFLLKDPRMCRLVGLWLSVLNDVEADPFVVNVFRHPIEVARSLAARNDLSTGHCLLLWLRYVLDAEFATRGVSRTFVDYSNVVHDWRNEFANTVDKLNCRLPKVSTMADPGGDGFIEAKLRHQRLDIDDCDADARLHAWLEDVLAALHVLHQNPYAAGAMHTLDRVRGEFDTACAAFQPAVQAFVRDAHDLRVSCAGMQGELNVARERGPKLEAEIEELRCKLAFVQPIADRVLGLEAEVSLLREALMRAAPLADKVLDLEAKISEMSLDVPWRWTGVTYPSGR